MLNFTVGPVQSNEIVCNIGSEQVPYFRTPEFSAIMKENEALMRKFSNADENARVVFITGSGTAAMEATVMNVYNDSDKVLIVNGGSFGQRFVDLCKCHEIVYSEIKLEMGKKLTLEMLQPYEGKGYTGFLVNVHETSTGVYYDMDLISDFCKRNQLLLVVDAISSFLADPFDMKAWSVDVMITGSQKALACPPGVSIIVLASGVLERIYKNECRSLYFDLKNALKDGKRGQTPYTPAVGILRQIHARLKEIDKCGGVDAEVSRVASLAQDFRTRIHNMPFELVSENMSNAITTLHPLNVSAYDVFNILKDEYNIWVCPNGGELADKIFRVGHIGDLTYQDNEVLVKALNDLLQRGLL